MSDEVFCLVVVPLFWLGIYLLDIFVKRRAQ